MNLRQPDDLPGRARWQTNRLEPPAQGGEMAVSFTTRRRNIMRPRIQLAAFVLVLSAFAGGNRADAQTPVLGGLVESRNYYNGYGVGDYGAYGANYRSFGAYDFYSGYGNGPYGQGSGSEHEFLSDHRYAHGDQARYDGYGYNGYYGQPRPQRYNSYGFGPKVHPYSH